MKRFLYSSLFLLVTLCSCHENIIDMHNGINVENDYLTSANDIIVLKENAIEHIKDIVLTDSLIVFYKSVPKDALPEVGAKIHVPISEKTPYGFLGRVLAIERGDYVKVYTESLPLEEAFPFLAVDTTINILNGVEGVFDAEGNPIDFEYVDSTIVDTIMLPNNAQTRAGGYWQGGLIKFKFDVAELEGLIYLELKNFDFNIDIVNNEIKYIDVKADPAFKVSLNYEIVGAKTPKELQKSKLIGSVNCAPVVIPTPIPLVSIILRPKLYVYLVYGLKGEVSVSTSLQYQCSYKTEMHYRNGQWDNLFHSNGPANEQPWVVGQFDLNGELYAGSKMGLLVGFYSATTGIGVNVTPKFSLGAEASLSTENLLDINPQVEIAAKWVGDLYFTASLFKKPIAHHSFSTPEYVVWSEKVYLLPQFKDFEAIGASSSAEINYQIDSHYFLSLLGVKTGTRVYLSDKHTEFKTYYQTPYNTDNKGYKYYAINADGLTPGTKYYASPICSWLGFTWPSSEKYEFTTEASYRFDFRCEGQSYDIISFSFSLNDSNSNSFSVNAEGQDYNNGPYFNAIIKGKLNKNTNMLEGTVEMNFVDLPEERRIDAFTIPIGTDDYVATSKVLDNGACYTAVRVTNNSQQYTRSYRGVILNENSDCNVGLSIY